MGEMQDKYESMTNMKVYYHHPNMLSVIVKRAVKLQTLLPVMQDVIYEIDEV